MVKYPLCRGYRHDKHKITETKKMNVKNKIGTIGTAAVALMVLLSMLSMPVMAQTGDVYDVTVEVTDEADLEGLGPSVGVLYADNTEYIYDGGAVVENPLNINVAADDGEEVTVAILDGPMKDVVADSVDYTLGSGGDSVNLDGISITITETVVDDSEGADDGGDGADDGTDGSDGTDADDGGDGADDGDDAVGGGAGDSVDRDTIIFAGALVTLFAAFIAVAAKVSR